MTSFATKWLALPAAVFMITVLISCSSAPTGPQPGSPESTWSAARQTVAAGDYNKALMHLDKLASKESDFQAKAQPWNLVLLAGLSKGYMDLAQSYEAGAKNNRQEPLTFRNKAMSYQRQAGRLTLQLAEAYDRFAKAKLDPVPIGFDMPAGNVALTPHLQRVERGMMPTQADTEASQTAMIDRAIMMTACQAAGAPEDPAKCGEVLKSGQVPAKDFNLAMAGAFYDHAQLYGRKKLDDPSRVKIFAQRASDLLKLSTEGKQSKELAKKIQALLKDTR